MRKFTILFAIIAVSFSSVAQDDKQDKKAIHFLVEMADTRLMIREEGRLATQLGSAKEVRDYGDYMVKDQTVFLDALKKVTASKNITLPNAISEKKSKGINNLKDKRGAEFDKKFLKMTIADHKRDLRQFKKASEYNDVAISGFAKQYLPTIEQHLKTAQDLKKKI